RHVAADPGEGVEDQSAQAPSVRLGFGRTTYPDGESSSNVSSLGIMTNRLVCSGGVVRPRPGAQLGEDLFGEDELGRARIELRETAANLRIPRTLDLCRIIS